MSNATLTIEEPPADADIPVWTEQFTDPEVSHRLGDDADSRVHNALAARRAYDRLIAMHEARTVNEAITNEEISRLEAAIQEHREWLERENARVDAEGERAYYEAILLHHVVSETAGRKTRYVEFPGGRRASLRKQQPEWQWPDQKTDAASVKALADWALENWVDAARVTVKASGLNGSFLARAAENHKIPATVELDKTVVKKSAVVRPDGTVCSQDGEVLPGIRVVQREDKFEYDLPTVPDAG